MSHTHQSPFLLELASKPPNVFYDLWLSLSSAHSSLWLTLRLSRERPLRLSVIEYQSTPDDGGAGGRIRDWIMGSLPEHEYSYLLHIIPH